jgi:hypothetical protein
MGARFKEGDLVMRGPIPGAAQTRRRFRITLITNRVFSAESADEHRSGWGGPVTSLHAFATPAPANVHPETEPK